MKEVITGRPRFIASGQRTFRDRVEEVWLRSIRLITYNTPIEKGKYRIAVAAENLCRNYPKRVIVPTKDGRIIEVNFAPLVWDSVFFFGEYELQLTQVVTALIRPGDVCVDIGANFGWYTTLLSTIVGQEGEVHAFEPVPATFEELRVNVDLLADGSNVCVYPLAVGDSNGSVTVIADERSSSGFASIGTVKTGLKTYSCEMIMLSDFVANRLNGREIDFLKADIEGAELLMLRGAESIFQQHRPPMMLIEMAADTSARLGYEPNDLLDFISTRHDYDFVAFDETLRRFRRLERFDPGHEGANVFCFPRGHFEDRLEKAERLFDS